jgi:hypothetical protein
MTLQRTIGNRAMTRVSQANPCLSALQRQEEKEAIQTARADEGGSFETDEAFDARLQSERGAGQPLPGAVRGFMEPRFGADLSAVRLHKGPEAADLNRQVNARAFTLGQDIFLGQGEENVDSQAGRGLLAHELTHVVQQSGLQPAQAGSNHVQRNTIQRFMSAADWKKHSSKTFGRRSAALKRIDAAVALYNTIAKKDTSERMQALTALDKAISDWLSDKGGSSGRMEAVNDLRRDVDVEFLALTMEMEQKEKEPSSDSQATESTSEQPEPEDESVNEKLRQLEAELDSGEYDDQAPEDGDEELRQLEGEMGDMELEPEEQDALDRETLEGLRAQIMAQRTIIEGLKTRRELAKDMTPDMIADLEDDIQEQLEISQQISEALSRPLETSSGEEGGSEAELQEMLDGMEEDDEKVLRSLEAEVESESAISEAKFSLGIEAEDPEAIDAELENAATELSDMESQAHELVLRQAQEGKIIGALLPLFMQYKTKKDTHGTHGIKSDVVQGIIDTMLGKPEFGELYELNIKKGDLAIQKAAEMAFGDTWTLRVSNGELSVVNVDADAALKAIAAPVRAECEKIVNASEEKLTAAFGVLAQAQMEGKVSGERSGSIGPVDVTTGGSVGGYMGVKGTAKVSAEINKLAKSIKTVAEASAQAGMGADMEGFIRAGYGKDLDVTLAGKLSTFFGAKGSVKAEFEATFTSLRLEAQANAMAGVEVTGETSVKGRWKHTEGTIDAQGEAFAGAKADVSGTVKLDTTGISLKGEANAFAGAKVSGSVGGSLGYKGKKMFSVRAKGEALAGAGAGASGEFTFYQGKLKISAEVSATLGLGLTGGTEVEVDFKVIGEAVLAQMKEFYDMIFPPNTDVGTPENRKTGLTSESRGKLYMAIYPAFVKYGEKKVNQGEHGLKRERLQALIDSNVILNKELVQDVKGENGVTTAVPLFKFAEADEVMTFAAMSALSGQLKGIFIQYGQIRSLDTIAKDAYVGLK